MEDRAIVPLIKNITQALLKLLYKKILFVINIGHEYLNGGYRIEAVCHTGKE